jgi:hypothetical protein
MLALGIQDPLAVRRHSQAPIERFSKTSDALGVISCEVQKFDRRARPSIPFLRNEVNSLAYYD